MHEHTLHAEQPTTTERTNLHHVVSHWNIDTAAETELGGHKNKMPVFETATCCEMYIHMWTYTRGSVRTGSDPRP